MRLFEKKCLHFVSGWECGGKCLVLPLTLATVFIFFAILYISDSYKGSIVMFSVVSELSSENRQGNSEIAAVSFSQSSKYRNHPVLGFFPTDLLDWIRACDRIAPLVLLDPRWLRCLPSSSQTNAVHTTTSTCLSSKNNGSANFTFALVAEEATASATLMKKLANASRNIGWTYKQPNTDNDSGYSSFLTKDGVSLIVSIMELRNFYWYVHGDPPRAFQSLNLTEIGEADDGDDQNGFLLAPTPVEFYLWQWPRSRFLECNHTSSEYLRGKYPELYKVPPVIKDSFVEILAYARDLFTKHRVTIMLAGGTALGWYRECGIIPHTTDTDMAFLASEWKPEVEEEVKTDKVLYLWWILGRPEDGMEITVNARSKKIDIFGLYEAGNITFVGAMNVGRKQKLRWWYPKLDGICTGDLKGQLFFVRCDIVAAFVVEYGPLWYEHHHSKDYVWHSSHFNVQNMGFYNNSEWPSVFRQFGHYD